MSDRTSDELSHREGRECWCLPELRVVEETVIVIHNKKAKEQN